MLSQISYEVAEHVGDHSTALPFAIVFITLIGVALISHYRQVR